MKRARVYRRGPRLFIHSVSKTPEGSWVIAPPFIKLEASQEESFLGETLLRVLDASRPGARDLGDEARKPLLELARARTWTVFMKDTFVCDVEKSETEISFFPAKNASRRPLTPEGEPKLTISADASPFHAGKGLRQAFASLEPKRRTPTKPKRSAPQSPKNADSPP